MVARCQVRVAHGARAVCAVMYWPRAKRLTTFLSTFYIFCLVKTLTNFEKTGPVLVVVVFVICY